MSVLRARLLDPLARQLTQGVSPARLALALALGIVLGTLPVLGATTVLCALAGVTLRLNQPAPTNRIALRRRCFIQISALSTFDGRIEAYHSGNG